MMKVTLVIKNGNSIWFDVQIGLDISHVGNPKAEISNDDLNYFLGFNDKTLQGPKKDFIQDCVERGDVLFGSDYDWKDESVNNEYLEESPKYKYCYNARHGHDSFILVYSNIEFTNCIPFNAEQELFQ